MLFDLRKSDDPEIQNMIDALDLLEKELKACKRGNYELADKYHEAVEIRCEAADAMRGEFSGVREWIAKLFRPLIESDNLKK